MKRLFKSLSLSLCIALCAGALTLSGCTSDSLTGPDLQTYGTETGSNNGGGGTSGGADHNEGGKTDGTLDTGSNNGGGGTSGGADHNEGG